MATTTPLNGWPVPTSTDYVKDGAVAIEALGDAIDTSVGSGLLAWQTYAPTLSSGWANGNGVWDAKYCQIGKTVHVQALFTVGTTTTKGTTCVVSLPVNAKSTTINPLNSGLATIGGLVYGLQALQTTASTVQLVCLNTSATYGAYNTITATAPGTWATGSIINFAFTYEAA